MTTQRGLALVDGVLSPLDEAVVPFSDLGFQRGWSVFETFMAEGGQALDLDAHLERLAVSCEGACIGMPPLELLCGEVERLVALLPGRWRIRITLTGSGLRVVSAAPPEEGRRHRPVRAVRGVHRDEPYLRGYVKHGSRAPWMVALTRSGVDEVLLVDESGRFTEGTSAGILAVVGGVLFTAPHDERILRSTTVISLIAHAQAHGIEVRREGPLAAGPWDALYIASVTRDIAPVVELDTEALPGWDPVGRLLQERAR